jgi:hypothetical protein
MAQKCLDPATLHPIYEGSPKQNIWVLGTKIFVSSWRIRISGFQFVWRGDILEKMAINWKICHFGLFLYHKIGEKFNFVYLRLLISNRFEILGIIIQDRYIFDIYAQFLVSFTKRILEFSFSNKIASYSHHYPPSRGSRTPQVRVIHSDQPSLCQA